MASPSTTLTPDFCVIGAGSGGLSFAAGAAQLGLDVVLLENRKMGGDCLNYGCVPSKALISAAKAGHYHCSKAQQFGFAPITPELDFSKVHEHIHSVIAKIEPHDSVERFTQLGVTVIEATGEFIDPRTVMAGDTKICAKHFIIATGSHPFIPPIPGLESVPFLTNESIFDLTERPEALLILGGGPIGLEMAQAFQRLGSQVTVVQRSRVLPRDQAESAAIVAKALRDDGVTIIEGAEVLQITQSTNGEISAQLSNGRAAVGSHLLVATGRKPSIQALGLDKGSIEYSEKGILVNQALRTSNRRVSAIGDCTGGYQFTHAAGFEAGLLIKHLIFKVPIKAHHRFTPWVTYTDPELAHVGESLDTLTRSGVDFTTIRLPFDQSDRAQAEGRTEGVLSCYVSKKGKVLGVDIVGPQAGELIYPWVMAMQNNLKLSQIASSIAPYPTLSDLTKRAAGQFYAPKLFSKRTQSVIKILNKIWRI